MKLTAVLVLCVLDVSMMFGGTPKPEAKAAVLAAEQAFITAMIKRDKGALERLLADDLVYVHSSSKAESKAEVIQVIASGTTEYESMDFKDTNVRQYGDVVITTHKATIKTKQTGVANLFVTHVWAKNKGGWQFASRQASRLPQ